MQVEIIEKKLYISIFFLYIYGKSPNLFHFYIIMNNFFSNFVAKFRS
jgi:hypothetical protein